MRVFWFGNHKLLITTELPRLRDLGYEVFCPNNGIQNQEHQSSSNGWSVDQPTTLPSNTFLELSKFDFFNRQITQRISKILNENFEIVIVTIDPGWLTEVIRNFRGKVVYRTYGHVVNMSDYLFKIGAMRAIIERDNFWYVPHSQESAVHEHSWLRDRMEMVPYCLGQDSLDNMDRWQPKIAEIMVSCPNIANPFYREHFKYLKKYFDEKFFRYYGVQTGVYSDNRLVGTMSFPQILQKFRDSKGFLYAYRSPLVCFLPPIEMMVTGGPVVFFQGSLLDQYFADEMAPGRACNESEALELCRRILADDQSLITAILASQIRVRARYLPDYVWPIFDKVFGQILSPTVVNCGKKKILNLSEYQAIEKFGSDELVVANVSSFLVTKTLTSYLVGGRYVKPILDYLKKDKRKEVRRILFVRASALPFWLGIVEPNGFDFMVCLDRDYPVRAPRQEIEPDRSKK